MVEDGIGLVRRFEDDLRRRGRPARAAPLARGARGDRGDRRAVRADPRPLLERIRVPGLRAEVVPVPNEFFGRAITVAGLLTGQDVARALSGRPLGDAVLIPRVALTETKGVFLDDVAPDDLARQLGVPIVSVEASARGLVGRPARPAARRGREGAVPVRLPVVAIVGRPNVGKSTLFNRLTGSRKAIVRDTPGVTRDRLHGTCEFAGWRATVIDTGGLDPTSDEPLTAQVRKQVLAAIAEADALVFVVDGREGLTPSRPGSGAAASPGVEAGAWWPSTRSTPRGARRRRPRSTAWGWSRSCSVSAEHGRGVAELIEALSSGCRRLPTASGGGRRGARPGTARGRRPPQRREVFAGERHRRAGAGGGRRRARAPRATPWTRW